MGSEADGFPSDEQRRVIEHDRGAAVVLAPAGTGKTRVMAARLARAVARGLDPGRSLGVTFTNRAAAEMRERVKSTLGTFARDVEVRTFHGLCAAFLRIEADAIGLPRDFVIYDEEDSIEVLGSLLGGRDRKVLYDLAARVGQAKSGARRGDLSLDRIPRVYPPGATGPELVAIDHYHELLAERHALDFGDLVFKVRAALAGIPEVARRWTDRYDFVQVDEVQDTHHSEYEVVAHLARRTGDLVFFGDVDQTIYRWRGSEPDEVLARFAKEFAPVTEISLSVSHRATKALLRAADRFARSFADRRTRIAPREDLPDGEPPRIERLADARAEAAFVAARCAELLRGGTGPRAAVLGRTHARLETISRALAARGVPHVTVEEFEFFRRQEVKDALSRLRLILNPADSGALHRVLLRPRSGVRQATLDLIRGEGRPCGLAVTDLARLRTHRTGEPFARLLGALASGGVVVLDVETTGLTPSADEVVEIAARRVGGARDGEDFHALLRNTVPVGETERIHGWSDSVLAGRGLDPGAAFRALFEFAGGAHLVGHNVRFDLAMILAHARRAGVAPPEADFDDTLDLARRFLAFERMDLATLAERLGLASRPSHRALDDCRATAELLGRLAGPLREGALARTRIVAARGEPFLRLAEDLDRWRRLAETERPPALLSRVLDESGLRRFYAAEANRTGHLDELVAFFEARDMAGADPRTALEHLTGLAALAKNVDHLDPGDPRIPVITVHQAKGLEFDTVFLVGLAEGEFPHYLAVRDGKSEEERHLFYVGLTRARRTLVLTSHGVNERGYRTGPSVFLPALDGAPGRRGGSR